MSRAFLVFLILGNRPQNNVLQVSSDENDGVKLFQALNQLSNPEDIPTLFGNIEGP